MGFGNLITKAVASVAAKITDSGSASVCELGNQRLKNSKARNEIYKQMDIVPPTSMGSTKEWYQSMGFANYLAIDVNTERDAVAMDLNLDIVQTYDFRQQFDLVTNNGTSEHVFNQHTIFLNCHNLCRVGGYMIHVLPFYRWTDHGFYNYHPNLFACLSNANQYDLQALWIATNDTAHLHELDTKNLSRNKGYRETLKLDSWERDPSVVAIMRKTVDTEFRTPMQHLYAGENITSPEIAERYQ